MMLTTATGAEEESGGEVVEQAQQPLHRQPHNFRPDRIIFASCNSQHYRALEQPSLWPAIISRNASAFVWTGDAIYADDFHPSPFFSKPVPKPATASIIKELYEQLLEDPGYRQLLEKTNMTVLGALDDHDYGCNNGDKTYEYKNESLVAFVDFLQRHRPVSSTNLTLMAQRSAAGKGAYSVKVFDFTRTENPLLTDEEAGLEPEISSIMAQQQPPPLSNRSVAIFLLDVRSNKTPWPIGKQKYFVDYEADFLGEEQWTWFETALQRSTAKVNLIVQGLQVHADRYWDGNKVESWSRFPASQHRLYQTVLKSNVSSPILISGDVHMAELLRKDCRQRKSSSSSNSQHYSSSATENPAHHSTFGSSSRMLLEVTTSGMTHSWGTNICARPKSSRACQSPLVAFSLMAGMHWAHNNYAWTDLVYENHPLEAGAKKRFQYVLDRNFGELEIDWENQRVIVRVFGSQEHGNQQDASTAQPLISTSWDFETLSGNQPPQASGKLHPSDFEQNFQEISYQMATAGGAVLQDVWICLNYGGHPSFVRKAFGVFTPVMLSGVIMFLPMILPLVLGYCFLRRRVRIGKV